LAETPLALLSAFGLAVGAVERAENGLEAGKLTVSQAESSRSANGSPSRSLTFVSRHVFAAFLWLPLLATQVITGKSEAEASALSVAAHGILDSFGEDSASILMLPIMFAIIPTGLLVVGI
jgi:hypothetical protein